MLRMLYISEQYAHPVGCLIVLSTHLVTFAIAGNSASPTFIRKASANACTNRANSTVYNASANASAITSTSALGLWHVSRDGICRIEASRLSPR